MSIPTAPPEFVERPAWVKKVDVFDEDGTTVMCWSGETVEVADGLTFALEQYNRKTGDVVTQDPIDVWIDGYLGYHLKMPYAHALLLGRALTNISKDVSLNDFTLSDAVHPLFGSKV